MPISCYIAAKIDSNYTAVYCHFDGHISNVGPQLLLNYNCYNKIKELISLKAIWSMDDQIIKIDKYKGDYPSITPSKYPNKIGLGIHHNLLLYSYVDGYWYYENELLLQAIQEAQCNCCKKNVTESCDCCKMTVEFHALKF